MTPRTKPTNQLSLLVNQDRRLDGKFLDGESPVLWGEIKLSGALRVRMDLHPGQELRINAALPDGLVIAGGHFVIETPSFPSERGKNSEIIGVRRVVSLSLLDNDLLAPTVDDIARGGS